MHATDKRELGWWVAVCVIALAGLALRIAAAQGALWTDEAWSVIYAAQAHDPLGVFLRINHDNNHHLYTLWLQLIGPTAPPLLARAPAILAGTLCIIPAALLGRRCFRAGGIAAALLFAVSPILVVYGSEARGYAMMLLAALVTLLLVGKAVDGKPVRGTRWWLAALALFGMFSHLTMIAPVAIATLWFYVERRAASEPKAATTETLRLMGPALAATAAAVLLVITAAVLSPTGMRVGGYEPFSWRHYGAALDDLVLWSAGFRAPWPWLIPLLLAVTGLAIALKRPNWLGSRARLFGLLILAVPICVAMVRPGNASFARYYLTSAIGLLLLISEWIGRGIQARPAVRAAAAMLLGMLVAVSLYRDSQLIGVNRGRPELAVRDMAALSPTGARVAFDAPRLKAVVALASARLRYAARFAGGCAPADFFLASQSRWVATPAVVHRCGVPMHAIDSSITNPLSGDSWVLYRPQELAKPQGR